MKDEKAKLTTEINAANDIVTAAQQALDKKTEEYNTKVQTAQAELNDAKSAYQQASFNYINQNCSEGYTYEDMLDKIKTYVSAHSSENDNKVVQAFSNVSDDTIRNYVVSVLSEKNLKKDADFVDEANKLRSDPSNYEGAAKELKIGYNHMMYSAFSSFASKGIIDHVLYKNFINPPGSYPGENIAWNYTDPFEGWYTEEKNLYDSGNRTFSDVGHYLNTADSDFSVAGFTISDDYVSEMNFSTSNRAGTTATPDEFRSALSTYMSQADEAVKEAEKELNDLGSQDTYTASEKDALAKAENNLKNLQTEADKKDTEISTAEETLSKDKSEAEALRKKANENPLSEAQKKAASAAEAYQKAIEAHDQAANDLKQAQADLKTAEDNLKAAQEANQTVVAARAEYDQAVKNEADAANALKEAEQGLSYAENQLTAAEKEETAAEKAKEKAYVIDLNQSDTYQDYSTVTEALERKKTADDNLKQAEKNWNEKNKAYEDARTRMNAISYQGINTAEVTDAAYAEALNKTITELKTSKTALDAAEKTLNSAKETTTEKEEEYRDAKNEYNSLTAPSYTPEPAVKAVKMYRLYNPNTGEHFFTYSKAEKDNAVAHGWSNEQSGFKMPESGDPIYRLYNPNGSEHHYTMDVDERDALVSKGWKYEGITMYSSAEKKVKVFRLYNPNAFSNNHHYTVSEAERDYLVSIGWRYEGVGFYASSLD